MTQEAPLGPPQNEDETAAAAPAAVPAALPPDPFSASVPALAPAPAPAPAPALEQLPPELLPAQLPATPYRTSLEPQALVRVTPRRSAVGEAIFVSGVLLWSFVVMGELTTSYAPGRHGMLVGEALAVVFVLATTGAAWGVAVRRNLASSLWSERAVYLRGTGVAIGALLTWCLLVYVATAMGKSASKNMDGPISLLLLVVSLGAALWGRRMAGLNEKAVTPRGRWLHRLLWTGAGLLTFVALVEILST